ncbi:unnamed protein product [Peronospora belbahrii]|uniref:Uncharacterized protein n=1 Tax=Peronospora belbahrii TaxID=622444 RepID=A0ABN8CQS2_9STRA|nr:unnamed protein product [Peronospora belbahrii]
MEPSNAMAVWTQDHVPLTSKLEPITSKLDVASAEKDPGCSWPSKKTDYRRSEMVGVLRGNSELARVQQMQEPKAGGVPRSVLQRLLSIPSAPGSPIHSPRHRCSAASAAIMHSPRAFANSDNSPFEKRESTVEPAPYHWCSQMLPAMECGSYESSSNCSSQSSSSIPIDHYSDRLIPSDDEEDENINEVVMLRQLVALLVKSLEHEKKRRASEQHLMQKKIIELQSLIREYGHENGEMGSVRKASSDQNGLLSTRENEPLENNQTRRWSAPVYDDERGELSSSGFLQKQKDAIEEAAAQPKLTRLRAQLHATVFDSQSETQTLRAQLESAKRSQNKREKELTLETAVKVTALEQKHAAATTQLAQQAANSAAQVGQLEAENLELVACVQVQQEHLKQLEIVDDFR